jgi:hypothetical protein
MFQFYLGTHVYRRVLGRLGSRQSWDILLGMEGGVKDKPTVKDLILLANK